MGDSFTESWCTLAEKRLMVNQNYGDTLDRLFFTLLDFCLQIPIGILYSLKQSKIRNLQKQYSSREDTEKHSIV